MQAGEGESLKKQHFSCRVYRSYLDYIRKNHAGVDLHQLCTDAGLDLEYLQNESNWVSCIFDERFMRLAIERTGDPGLAYKVGLNALSPEGAGSILILTMVHLLKVGHVYSSLQKFQNFFSRVTKTTLVSHRSGELKIKLEPVLEHLNREETDALLRSFSHIVQNTIGHFTAVPTLRGFPAAQVSLSERDDLEAPLAFIELRYSERLGLLKYLKIASVLIILAFSFAFAFTGESSGSTYILVASLPLVGTLLYFLFENRGMKKEIAEAYKTVKQMDERYAELFALEQKQKILSQAAQRFIPWGFLDLVKRTHLPEVKLGDHAETNLTYLFLDIRGFTQLSETLTSEELFEFINSFYERICPFIEKHQGEVDKFTGDGFMAVFGGSALDALTATKEIFKELKNWNIERSAKGLHEIRISVGMSSGRSTVGVVGWQRRTWISPISRSVNFGAKLESLNRDLDSSVLIDHATSEYLPSSGLLARYVGDFSLSGNDNKQPVYEIYGLENQINAKQLGDDEFQAALGLIKANEKEKAISVLKAVLVRTPSDGAAIYWLKKLTEATDTPHPSNKVNSFRLLSS